MTAPEIDDLYREVILDHYRKPRNRGLIEGATLSAEGVNPICGDQVKLSFLLDGDRIAAVGFKGSGCSISQASASLMTEAVKARTLADAARMQREVEVMMTEGAEPAEELGDMQALQGVTRFPARIKCALLPWKTLGEAIEDAKRGV